MPHIKTSYTANKNEYLFIIQDYDEFIGYTEYLTNGNHYLITLQDLTYLHIIDKLLSGTDKNPAFDRKYMYFIVKTQYQQSLVSSYGFNYIDINDKDHYIIKKFDLDINNIQFDTIEKLQHDLIIDQPSWAFNEQVFINYYYKHNDIRIFTLENLDHNWHVLPYLKNTDYVFIIIGWNYEKWNFEYCYKCLATQNPGYNKKNIIWLCNNLDQLLFAHEYGFDGIFCNQNILINSAIFDNTFSTLHTYDLVLNCRPEKFKRPYLAKQVSNLAIIKGYMFNKDDYYDLYNLSPSYINNDRLTQQEVASIYNKSLCGGSFSHEEGACFSAGEMLLCGLPIISTLSYGGRDVWFTKYNSIIIEPTEDAVTHAINTIKTKYSDYAAARSRIRSDYLKQVLYFNTILANKLYALCPTDSCDFMDHIANTQLRKSMTISDAIDMLKSNA